MDINDSKNNGSPKNQPCASLVAFAQLKRATGVIEARLLHMLSKLGLNESQYGVLEALHQQGPLCQRALADLLIKSPGNVTQVIDALEKRQLVRRTRQPEDRRFFYIELTHEGQTLVESVMPQVTQAISLEMAQLSREELNNLGALCLKLGASPEATEQTHEMPGALSP